MKEVKYTELDPKWLLCTTVAEKSSMPAAVAKNFTAELAFEPLYNSY